MDLNVTLSAGSIRTLQQQLRVFADEVAEGEANQEIRELAGNILLEELKTYVQSITDRDGNDVGSFRLKSVFRLSQITWSGSQVVYLEFGTGVVAITGPAYGDQSIPASVGYEPQQYHGLSNSEIWSYYDDMGQHTTKGIIANAPMYRVALNANRILQDGGFKAVVGKAIERAIKRTFV